MSMTSALETSTQAVSPALMVGIVKLLRDRLCREPAWPDVDAATCAMAVESTVWCALCTSR